MTTTSVPKPSASGKRPFHYPRREPYLLIEDYALIGDGMTAALVSNDGSLDWCCLPRFDSPSVFARILDCERGGYWQIAPLDEFRVSRHYLDDTTVLVTRFTTDSGEAELLDFMPAQSTGPDLLGISAIVRMVRGIRGTVRLALHLDPRFDYARALPEGWTLQPGKGARTVQGGLALTLYTTHQIAAEGSAIQASFSVTQAQETNFVLTCRRPPSVVWRTQVVEAAPRLLAETVDFWQSWIARCRYDGPYREMVRRSALTLKLLHHAPTGAIVAAPTTSLPEALGGVRNWDYRYAWVRDTAFTIYALFLLGYREEGESFFDWLVQTCQGDPAQLQVLFGVGGERGIEEFELPHLRGYKDSAPVRVGNAAHAQVQHDLYGDVLDSAYLLHKYGGVISGDLWKFLHATVERVLQIWQQPGQGIWEVRSRPRHFVYSKALCWVAVDRGIKLAERLGHPADLQRWHVARDAIMDDLLAHGYNRRLDCFTQAYGSTELDAATIAIPLRKVLPASDPRVISTVKKVVERLESSHLLHRYGFNAEDGLPPGEGVFLLCSFWLVDVYAEMGEIDRAQRLLEHLLSLANDVGLYAEEIEPATGSHLGNFPQAFTHVALINAVHGIEQEKARLQAPRTKAR